jgi:hypothetical protein
MLSPFQRGGDHLPRFAPRPQFPAPSRQRLSVAVTPASSSVIRASLWRLSSSSWRGRPTCSPRNSHSASARPWDLLAHATARGRQSSIGIRPRKSGSRSTPRWKEMDSNHRSLAREPASVGRRIAGDRGGIPQKVVFYGVPTVRIHLPPAGSLLRTPIEPGATRVSREPDIPRLRSLIHFDFAAQPGDWLQTDRAPAAP